MEEQDEGEEEGEGEEEEAPPAKKVSDATACGVVRQ